LLKQALGVEPGSVTPFALINDRERRVLVILDADMMQAETVNYHPLRNDASTTIRADDLMKFVRALGGRMPRSSWPGLSRPSTPGSIGECGAAGSIS